MIKLTVKDSFTFAAFIYQKYFEYKINESYKVILIIYRLISLMTFQPLKSQNKTMQEDEGLKKSIR
jgi:hypothetical protein